MNTLQLMENILEIDALLAPGGVLENNSVHTVMARDSMIISWLFITIEQTRDQKHQDETLRGRCFELLALISQNVDLYTALPDWSNLPNIESSKNNGTSKTGKGVNGIESLLQSIALFRKRQPSSDGEIEILENSCIVLSSCISFSASNLSSFLDGQGVELVIRCLKERVHAGGSSLKLLDFFGDEDVYKIATEKLVHAGGLKFLFPIFVGRRIPKPAIQASRSLKAKRKWLSDLKVQIIRIFYALTFHLDKESPEDAMSRFITKFVEGT